MDEKEFLEDLKDLDGLEMPPEKKPSQFQKAILFIGGVIIMVLMVSFIFSSYPISNIIQGMLESKPLQGNIIELKDFSIIFEESTHEILKEIYLGEQKVEFSVCLQGEKRINDYYINSLYQPVMYDQAFNHVSFEPCSEETLVVLHSHPYKSCIASQADMQTLQENKKINPKVLMVVMCEPDRFSVYG